MLAKTVCFAALVASAAAYAPTMSLSANRRQVIAGAGAAVVAAPLASNAAIKKDQKAPIITIFDNRGCEVKKNNYSGAKANGMEDDQCVKLTMETITVSETTAAKKLQEFIGLKATAINVPQISGVTKKY
uniref:Phycoerythrin alpha subunit L1 n=2 Tax=Chroomonas sp. M1627 TaxID=478123 RepID=A0A067XP78_9CRYP|nr:phycoerythrin alpha subunit L1 [Chroomonas sp. M1627]